MVSRKRERGEIERAFLLSLILVLIILPHNHLLLRHVLYMYTHFHVCVFIRQNDASLEKVPGNNGMEMHRRDKVERECL